MAAERLGHLLASVRPSTFADALAVWSKNTTRVRAYPHSSDVRSVRQLELAPIMNDRAGAPGFEPLLGMHARRVSLAGAPSIHLGRFAVVADRSQNWSRWLSGCL